MIIPTYYKYLTEAKTAGHEFETAVYYAIIRHVNNNKLFVKPLRIKIDEKLIDKYGMITQDIALLFKNLLTDYGDDLLVKKVIFIGDRDTPRKFSIEKGKITSPLTPGKDLADIQIQTTKGDVFLSLKFGTALITLCNVGISKLSDEQMNGLFDFLGFDKMLFTSGLDAYTTELYNIVKAANEVTVDNNIKIKPPEKLGDQQFLYDWFVNIMDTHFPDKNIVVSGYSNWICKTKGKWYGRTKPHYDTDPDNAIDSPNHENRLLDVILGILENKAQYYTDLESFRKMLIDTGGVAGNGKIKNGDQFFKFNSPEKKKEKIDKPVIDRKMYANYQDMLHWSLGQEGDYYLYYGHLKKKGHVFKYDNKYLNANLKITDVTVESIPDSSIKTLIFKIHTNSADEYTLTIRNKSGGVKPQILSINQRKKW